MARNNRPSRKSRSSPGSAREPAARIQPAGPSTQPTTAPPQRSGRLAIILAVIVLLALHVALAERSLVQENPTVDEVVHLPAGVTYWQKGTFRLYHHSPPLVRMIAALPVILLGHPETALAYQQKSWTSAEPSPPTFSQTFALLNSAHYFDLFNLARMVMPFLSVLGALVVFEWSRRLYGSRAGLLSLCLWVFCPNILAHCRLVTTDVGSTTLGVAATFVYWLYLRSPSWRRAALAGVMLGLAELTKFSMLLLYAVWPLFWLVHLVLVTPAAERLRRAYLGIGQGLLVAVVSILVIDAGYGFEGVGIPLGKFEFASSTLTTPVPGLVRVAPASQNPLYQLIWPFRENRFRGTHLASLPAPLPEHYLLGFDEQKVEADGIPNRYSRASKAIRERDIERAKNEASSNDRSVAGYTVYLNGVLRSTGWWHYYIDTLLYKVPEGTWLLVVLSLLLLILQPRTRAAWADAICLWTVPVVVLFSMSFLTDINLGLRYILSIAPYVYIAAGSVVPWADGLNGIRRLLGRLMTMAALGLTVAATLWIHPHYLAYFNWVSGGPDRVPVRLIDSNLDWGQDLVGLRAWCHENAPGQPIGLAYFGQINPSMFGINNPSEKLDWFLPAAEPGTIQEMPLKAGLPPRTVFGPQRLSPGYYAVSATLVYGLHWRLYDPSPATWEPVWTTENNAFSYFQQFTPIARIGHSIYVYRLSQQDVDRVGPSLYASP